DEIAIAGPLLRRSPVIDEKMLLEIASEKGQGHLLAMAERPTLSSDLTDVIVARGERDVIRRAAGNAGAAFSSNGYSTLIKRAGQDGVLTIRLGQRDDLSPAQLKDLLAGSIDVVRRRLSQVVKPDRQAVIKQARRGISGVTERATRRAFAPARRPGRIRHRAGPPGGLTARSSLRANGSRECAPDDRLREAIHKSLFRMKVWIASGQFGHIDNHDPIELLGRERGKRMVWEAIDLRKARMMGEA